MTASGSPLTNTTTSGRSVGLALHHGELVDGQPVVGVGVVEVDEPGLVAGDAAVGPRVLDVDAVDEHAVEAVVVLERGSGVSATRTFFSASSIADAGSCGLMRSSAARRRRERTTSVKSSRSAASFSGSTSGPYATS